MATIQELYTQSTLAQAGYADLSAGAINKTALIDKAGMSDTQAADFAAKWTVVNQYQDASGAGATIFQETSTGKKYLAIRGTEPTDAGDLNADYILALGFPSYLNPQFIQLRGVVQGWLENGSLNAGFTVAGHSLGGYLSAAIGTWFGGSIYTFNAPGIGGPMGNVTDAFRAAFGLSEAPGVGGMTNIRGTAGISLITGLGAQLVPPQLVETEFAANPMANHSVVNLTDSLGLFNLYATLDPTLTINRLNVLTLSAGNVEAAERENGLDALRKLMGFAGKTPTDDREAYWSNLLALQKDVQEKALQGKVRVELLGDIDAGSLAIRAKEDFGALLSLNELSPIRLVGKDAAAHAVLSTQWTNAFGGLHAQWLHDSQLSAEDRANGNACFSDEYLTDRAAMLGWIASRNVKDLADGGILDGPAQLFRDVASGTEIRMGIVSDANRRQFLFGADGDDVFSGGGKSDRLYGGGGADKIEGRGGNDRLEGNAGDDALDGGDGDDTYRFQSGDGNDTIRDNGGNNTVEVDGIALTGGKLIAKSVDAGGNGIYLYRSDDGKFVYQYEKGAQLSQLTVNGTLKIDDFKPEHYAQIALPEAFVPVEQAMPAQAKTGDTAETHMANYDGSGLTAVPANSDRILAGGHLRGLSARATPL